MERKEYGFAASFLGALGTVFSLLGSFFSVGMVCGTAALALGISGLLKKADGEKKKKDRRRSALAGTILGASALGISCVFLLFAAV